MAALATEEAWPSALVGAGMAATALAVAIGRDPSDSSAASVPPTLLLFVGVPLAAGVALRRRQHRADSHLAQAAEAGARERRRIARELHDVVAHGVSVMVIQAQAAQRVLASDPGAAREALGAIEATGRDAMGELRTLLGLLRDDGDAGTVGPAPGLAGLPDLTRRLAESGLDVDVRVTGVVEPLAPGVDRSAYRIVQESLTNALRHGRDGRAEVVIGYGPRSVDLEIGNPAGASNGAPGLGVAGMRERASALGGTLGTGLEGTRYVVRASLPR